MTSFKNTLTKERKTIKFMIQIYCKKNHYNIKEALCEECKNLLLYANERLDNCFYRENKPACSNCSIHCYNKDMRGKIRKIMRYSGPKMVFKHPFLALSHLYKLKVYKKSQI